MQFPIRVKGGFVYWISWKYCGVDVASKTSYIGSNTETQNSLIIKRQSMRGSRKFFQRGSNIF